MMAVHVLTSPPAACKTNKAMHCANMPHTNSHGCAVYLTLLTQDLIQYFNTVSHTSYTASHTVSHTLSHTVSHTPHTVSLTVSRTVSHTPHIVSHTVSHTFSHTPYTVLNNVCTVLHACCVQGWAVKAFVERGTALRITLLGSSQFFLSLQMSYIGLWNNSLTGPLPSSWSSLNQASRHRPALLPEQAHECLACCMACTS